MPKITAMCWNVWNLGISRYKAGQPGSNELIRLIAAVILKNKASIVGLLEIDGNIGSVLVNVLKNELNNRTLITR